MDVYGRPLSGPIIYVITPTYQRMAQQPDLTRLAQTLSHVPNLLWIVVEDAATKSQLVKDLLNRAGVNYTHLNVKTPDEEIKAQARILAFHLFCAKDD